MLLLAVVAGVAVVFLQPLLWHLQTGNWFEWGYRNEGFHWDRPEFIEVLFGFRRGLFLWTPIFLLPVISILLLWRYDRVRSAAALGYFAANLYVISAWWIWYYGSGFGSRVFIDHYPVLVIPMALVLSRWSSGAWMAARLFMVLCILLHLAQFTQYHLGVFDYENMDRAKYRYTFLRFGEDFREQLGGKDQAPPFNPNGMSPVLMEGTDLERSSQLWRGGRIAWDDRAYSGKHVAVYDADTEFGPAFEVPPGTLPLGREIFLEVAFMRYEARARDSFHAIGVVDITDASGNTVHYLSWRMNDLPGQQDDHWERIQYRLPLPAMERGGTLRFYLWNQDGKGEFLVDDLFARVWAVDPH
jgi:hypothetical protein